LRALQYKEHKKIDKTSACRTIDFLGQRIAKLEDPRSIGYVLMGAELVISGNIEKETIELFVTFKTLFYWFSVCV
jgi:hypothetical protein